MLEKGLVQIYTGEGKGKTTAAFGAALRAAGQGNKVLVYQFLKPASLYTGERFAIQSGAVNIRFEALDVPWDMSESLKDEKTIPKIKNKISDALKSITQSVEKRKYDMLILDEIVFCLSEGLAELEDVKDLIDKRDSAVEIVLTGRGATAELIELADLVTEMKNIKHPFDKGMPARKGIEY